MGGKGKKFRGNAYSASLQPHTSLHPPNHKSKHAPRPEKPFRQNSLYPQQGIHTKKHPSHSRLPIQLKQPHKSGSSFVKRSRMSGTSSKKPQDKVELSGPTGLEDIEELQGDLGMTKVSDSLPVFMKQYRCRDKKAERDRRRSSKARYSRIIKQQRKLSNRVRHNSTFTIVRQRGMENLTGTLCYRHSLFQALIHIPMFTNWLMMHNEAFDCVESDPENCVPCVMKAVAMAYRTAKNDELRDALKLAHKVFKIHKWSTDTYNSQGDAEEQFKFITGMMAKQAPSASFKIFEASHGLLVDSLVKCNDCSYTSRKEADIINVLPVGLKPRAQDRRLTSYIKNYMIEPLEDYKCDKCANKEKKVQEHQISHFPDMLTVQLMRFDYDGRKDGTRVEFGTSLDLGRYRSPLNNYKSTYELLAVVIHAGSLDSGHYICAARGVDGEWYKFNDEKVTKIRVEDITHPRESNWTPYLLFYQRNKD